MVWERLVNMKDRREETWMRDQGKTHGLDPDL